MCLYLNIWMHVRLNHMRKKGARSVTPQTNATRLAIQVQALASAQAHNPYFFSQLYVVWNSHLRQFFVLASSLVTPYFLQAQKYLIGDI